MLNRREFLQLSIAGAGGLAATGLLGEDIHSLNVRPLGVQLYTVRQEAERDLPAVLSVEVQTLP